MEKELKLRDLYYSFAKKGTFLSAEQLFQQAKKSLENENYTRDEIKDFLEKQEVYNKYKKFSGIKNYRKTKVYDLAEQIQVDLVIMTSYSKDNPDYNYILVCIEILSRTLFAQPTKRKDAKSVAFALQDVLQDFHARFGKYPKFVQFDEGNEFKGAVLELLRKHNIKHFYTHSIRQASVVERVNRTLQEKLRKLWHLEKNQECVSNLSDVVESYNAQKHRSLGNFSPNDVNESNKWIVWGRLFGEAIETIKSPKFRVDDLVRVYHFKTLHRSTRDFLKYYKEKYQPKRSYAVEAKNLHPFSEEIFRITKVKPLGNIIVYKLRSDAADQNTLGYFYEDELSLVRKT